MKVGDVVRSKRSGSLYKIVGDAGRDPKNRRYKLWRVKSLSSVMYAKTLASCEIEKVTWL